MDRGAVGRHLLISFADPLAAYGEVGVALPIRGPIRDIARVANPAVAGNIGDYFIIGGNYTSERPTSWFLRDVAPRNLASKIGPVSRNARGGSGRSPLKSRAAGRKSQHRSYVGLIWRTPMADSKFRYSNLVGSPVSEVRTAIKLRYPRP